MSYFHSHNNDLQSSRYDIRTLVDLEAAEVNKNVFAHLCRYDCQDDTARAARNKSLYRICLQDDRILDAVDRGKTFIKLYPLLLYIATHELVHIVRFGRGESDFDALPEEKIREEERVHTITHNMLTARGENDLALVLDCFSDNYKIEAY